MGSEFAHTGDASTTKSVVDIPTQRLPRNESSGEGTNVRQAYRW